MQTKIKFPQLCPISSPDMRDKYCNLREKATSFLEKNGIIESFEILDDGHRWEAFMKIDLNIENFIKEYEKIKEKHQMKMEGKMDIKEIKEKRFQFLHMVYNLSNADENKDIKSYELGEDLGFSADFTSKVISYLDKERLIRFKEDSGITIGISHDGIKEVESALSKPEEPTEHFPPVKNLIIIKDGKGTQIQIDSPHATQTQTIDSELIEKLKDLISFIESSYSQLKLPRDKEEEFNADVKTIEAQMSSPLPKRNVLKECISSIRKILETATGQIIAMQILDKLPAIENMLRNL